MSNKVYVTVGIDGRNVPSGGLQNQVLTKNSNDDYDLVWADADGGGGGGGGIQPATSPPPPDTDGGSVGSIARYAYQNHAHELNVTNTNPLMNGSASPGVSDYYSRSDHVHDSDTYAAGFVLASTNFVDDVADLQNIPNPVEGQIAFVKA